jgi:4'-phosphopantetheinyl transferase
MPKAIYENQDSLLHTAHVWYVNPDRLPAAELRRRWLPRLCAQERATHKLLKTPRLRHVYLASRALCRAALSRHAGIDPQDWKFIKNRYGKPRIVAPARFRSLNFNLTHTNGLIACVVTRSGEIGMDAENILRSVEIREVGRLVFSKIERADLAKKRPDKQLSQFFKMWVLKEAYLKGLGTGMWREPAGVTIRLNSRGHPLPLDPWQFSLHRPTKNHVAAVAIRARPKRRPVKIHWHRADDLLLAGRCKSPARRCAASSATNGRFPE